MRNSVTLLICIAALLMSCGKRSVEIDRNTRLAIDTLAGAQIRELRPVLDSLCDAQFDSLVQHAMDSILERRQHEMEQIIQR